MWRMLQAETPEDYVIGTGILHTVKDLVETAFGCVDLDWQRYVEVNPNLLRRDEHFQLVANPTKANVQLNWSPKISFEELIEKMVHHDLQRLRAGQEIPSKSNVV
jgi:GDPmannose 4,6-dehydratase